MNYLEEKALDKIISFAVENAKSHMPQKANKDKFLNELHNIILGLCKNFNLSLSPEKLEEALRSVSKFSLSQLGYYEFKSFLSLIFGKDTTDEHISFCLEQAGNDPEDSADNVQKIIWQYADSFTKPLFLHEGEDKNHLVNLTNLYVKPKFEYKSETIDTETLVESFLRDRNSNLLFIEGGAAVGKTTLVAWLCYQYLFGDKSLFQNRPLVCVRLREVDVGEHKQYQKEYLFSYLHCTKEDFRKRYKNAIVLLDGADELNMISGQVNTIEDFISKICSIRDFPDCKWIITGRERYIVKSSLQTGYQEAELKPFDTAMKKEWVFNYCNKCKGEIPENIKKFIEDTDTKDAVMDTPLTLYLLAQSKGRDDLWGNPWYLYNQIFSSHLYKTPYNQTVAEDGETIEGWLEKDYSGAMYSFLGKIAFEMVKNQKDDESIASGQLESLIKEEPVLLDLIGRHENVGEWLKSLCAICAYWKENGQGALEFYHNNIRDFFFCEYIYGKIQACLQLENEEEPINTEKFIEAVAELFPHKHLSSKRSLVSTWEQTFVFLFYRLRYEYSQENRDESLCSLVIKKDKNPFPDVLYQLASKPLILSHLGKLRYDIPPMKQIETICINTIFLFHIWQEIYRENRLIKYIRIWNNLELEIKNAKAKVIGDMEQHIFWENNSHILSKAFCHRVFCHSQRISVASWTCLTDINLMGADLSLADMTGANMTAAKLNRANLVAANLTEVNLDGANLTGAIFEGANLNRANLKLSLNLKEAKKLNYSVNLEKAILPLDCHIKKLTKDFSGEGPYYEITWD